MERRDLLTALGFGAATLAMASPAAAAETSMHPALYQRLSDANLHCVATANACLRHCIGMIAMKDDSMAGCINTAYQVVVACGALQALAAVNSPAVPGFAKATAEICLACQKECEKHLDVAECKVCGESCKDCAAECQKAAA
jgi:Cys-rich four helix bundle protein (predicted Tat secretion target)